MRVHLTTKDVQRIVARGRKGESYGKVAEDLKLKGHVVREVYRAEGLAKATPEIRERAQQVILAWVGKGPMPKRQRTNGQLRTPAAEVLKAAAKPKPKRARAKASK